MIIIHVENDSFDEDYVLLNKGKRGQIMQGGGTPSDLSDGHLSPGGECFAPCFKSALECKLERYFSSSSDTWGTPSQRGRGCEAFSSK